MNNYIDNINSIISNNTNPLLLYIQISFNFILCFIFGFLLGYCFEYFKDKYRNFKRGTIFKTSKRMIKIYIDYENDKNKFAK